MKPKTRDVPTIDDLFRSRLDHIINGRHELVKLAERIDWAHLYEETAPLPFYAEEGRPGYRSAGWWGCTS
jgi:IS5 family transposase